MKNLDRNPSIPQEFLAALVDGELSPAQAAKLREWLETQPDAQDLVEAQESLTAMNELFVAEIAPPAPSQQHWDKVLAAIVAATDPQAVGRSSSPPMRQLWQQWAIMFAIACSMLIALTVVIWRTSPTPQLDVVNRIDHRHLVGQPDGLPDSSIPEPVIESELFAAADVDDVVILRLPDVATNALVIGRPPMLDEAVILAGATDIEILSYGPDDRGLLPDVQNALGPDTPLVWASSGPKP